MPDQEATGTRGRAMRAEVAASWQRSAAAGVPADADAAPITLPGDVLRDYRQAHPLARLFPILDDVLGQAARDCEAVMAIADAAGQLLWVCGQPSVLRRAERIGFVEGSNWDERLAGTNAPGMAIQLKSTVTVLGTEHFRRAVRSWSCAATPIHDPSTSAILGVLDITGGPEVGGPQTVALVRAAARMAEAELARDMLTRSTGPPQPATGLQVSLECLGRSEALLTIRRDGGGQTTLRLSPRHSEVVVLLAAAPQGLSGDELAVLLYEDSSGDSTMRAQMNRLRGLVGDELLSSRPYRLGAAVAGDWFRVEALLAAGDVAGALRSYRGPLLPRSTAPGVERLRTEVEESVRHAVLRSGSADLMATWTRSHWGADDYEMWRAQWRALSEHSPLRALVEAQIVRLDRELGIRWRPGVPVGRPGGSRAT